MVIKKKIDHDATGEIKNYSSNEFCVSSEASDNIKTHLSKM